MDMLDQIFASSASIGGWDRGGGSALERAWPVGQGEVFAYDTAWGHDVSRFAPDDLSAERYITANEIYSLCASRARLMQDVELKFYQGRGSKKKEIEDGRAVELHQYVNPFWSQARLSRMDEMAMCLWGATYWAVEPPSKSSPLGEIWWLKASRVKPAPHPAGYLAGFWYESQVGQRIFFTPDEIVFFRYPNPIDEFAPLSPLVAAKLAADTAASMMKSNQKLFDQGMQLAGLVVPPNDVSFSKDQADDLEKHLQKRFSGPKNAHRWAVLRYEAQFKPMSMNPKDAEYVSGLAMTFRQACRAYGMQATLHNDLEQASPGDTDALERIEWARTLAPDLRLRGQEVREQYLPRFSGKGEPDHCEHDFSTVPAMQEAQGAVWEREAGWMDRGLVTINEWRERHGFPPVPWGDAPWMPMNKGQFLPEGQQPKGVLVIPGQNAPGAPGEAGGPGVMQGPQDGLQGGPQLTDETGVPLPKPPDDEMLPTNQPQRSVHMQARDFLATGEVREFLARAFKREGLNGHKLNGHRIGAR